MYNTILVLVAGDISNTISCSVSFRKLFVQELNSLLDYIAHKMLRLKQGVNLFCLIKLSQL